MCEKYLRLAGVSGGAALPVLFLLIAGSSAAYANGPTGILEICKASDPSGPVTGTFTFTISGVTGSVTAPVNGCTGPLTVPAGQVTVTEAAVTGVGVTNIVAQSGPPDARVNQLVRSDLGARTAVVNVQAGGASVQTFVTFTNRVIPTGVLEICKDAAPGTSFPSGTTFTFTITGVPGTFTAPVGACTGPITVPAGSVTVTETARPDATLVDVVATP